MRKVPRDTAFRCLACSNFPKQGGFHALALHAVSSPPHPSSQSKLISRSPNQHRSATPASPAGLHGNAFRIKPPMCWTKADVDFAVAVMDQALSEL